MAGTRQASFPQPGSKNQFIISCSMSSASDIKLIRTDFFYSLKLLFTFAPSDFTYGIYKLQRKPKVQK